ncbi:eukaryotic translation initiation factor 2D-like [Suncus etruscus]|uniref:eukaryotic translation initiation factor 2D-like n=1 Tax=Suncus etruscus TaxID=109475 RepID=UPI00210F2BE3|nr:eukaryotic translation initiation factor 2D-like [Suncus etruscus]
MFTKSFRIKSKAAVQDSDIHKLRDDALTAFSTMALDEVCELIPSENTIILVHMETFAKKAVAVYVTGGNPILFELDNELHPTVYTLWRFPHLIPTFLTWPIVLEKLIRGCDLMLPGLLIPPEGLPVVQKGELCGIAAMANRAPIAIGFATMSTAKMLRLRLKGKGFCIIHTYQDHLWQYGQQTTPPVFTAPTPALPGDTDKKSTDLKPKPKNDLTLDEDEDDDDDDESDILEYIKPKLPKKPSKDLSATQKGLSASQEDLSASQKDLSASQEDLSASQKDLSASQKNLSASQTDLSASQKNLSASQIDLSLSQKEIIACEEYPSVSPEVQQHMDKLLEQCFILALIYTVKEIDLPLLPTTLFNRHMLPCCPERYHLDIRKTSYRNMSKFLYQMQQENILEVKEVNNKVESVVAINWEHPKISPVATEKPSSTFQMLYMNSKDEPYQAPEIKQLYFAPSNMTQLFQVAGFKKGSPLEGNDVREALIEYAKANNLFEISSVNSIKMDALLRGCILNQSEKTKIKKLSWASLLNRCFEKMQPGYQLTFPGKEPIVKRGEIKPISITVTHRNLRIVTFVQNLETYGLNPYSVAIIIQERSHCSASVYPMPETKDSLIVQIHGNQGMQLRQLLHEDYKLPLNSVATLERLFLP